MIKPRPKTPLNPEFSSASPTNGFGEIESIVAASLYSPSAPRPNSATPRTARKVCIIHSPVTTGRAKSGGDRSLGLPKGVSQHARPHTADAATYRQHGYDVVHEAMGMPYNISSGIGGTGSGRLHHRPVTSNSLTSVPRHQLHNEHLGNGRGGVDGIGEGELTPLTSGGERRRGLRNRSDDGRGISRGSWDIPGNEKERNEQDQAKSHEMRHLDTPPRHNTPPSCFGGRYPKESARKRDIETPPSRYWPMPGGAKSFLRPFIERNRSHLWIYDPALTGMNHIQAYRHIRNKGKFEAMKRSLLEKEDAFSKGTGSVLMADTIGRFRGATPGRYGRSSALVVEGSEPRRLLQQQQQQQHEHLDLSPAVTDEAVELDPFQCGGRNSDKLAREEARRRDLRIHAKQRTTVFCRRKGYEPGDFLELRERGGRKRAGDS